MLVAIALVGVAHKFDEGLYDRILEAMREVPVEGARGVYDGTRYYDVLMVVSRDDGDGRSPDETARENKAAVVRLLEDVGAVNITAADSLSFVTAMIPVASVPGFSLHDEVYAMGDGERAVVYETDGARPVVKATPEDLRRAVGSVPTGRGVTVAIVDEGLNSTYINDRVEERIYCTDETCRIANGDLVGSTASRVPTLHDGNGPTHGTMVAQILGGSGMPRDAGLAPGVTFLDAWDGHVSEPDPAYLSNFAHAIDWAHRRGADIVNISVGAGICASNGTNAFDLVINEAVDKGTIVVKSAGNKNVGSPSTSYRTVTSPGCAHNSITVGGIDTTGSGSDHTMYTGASRGPVSSTLHRLVPHLAAPAVDISTPDFGFSSSARDSGTSYATPQVSAIAAMMLELRPELTPAEVKAALLLGAEWKGPVSCTSSDYEQNLRRYGNCSYKMQPRSTVTSNNAASLGILNNVGLGIADASRSLRYVNSASGYVVSGSLEHGTATSKAYRFTVTDASEPVKVILTWMAHPHGGIEEQQGRTGVPLPVADLDFVVKRYGTTEARAESDYQNTEFAVFDPRWTGTYVVTVTGSGLDTLNKPVQNFAIASTLPLYEVPARNSPPSAHPAAVVAKPGMETPIRVSASDSDGDSVSFHVSAKPRQGVVSADEFISRTVSRVVYTPYANFTGTDTFAVRPHDGLRQGAAANVTVTAESLPPGARDAAAISSGVRDWDTMLDAPNGLDGAAVSRHFPGPSYAVSALYVGSSNLEGVDIAVRTTGGTTYTAAVPPSGVRMIQLQSPVTISPVTISADAVDEEAADGIGSWLSPDVRAFVGYVPSSCSASGAASGSSGAASGSSGAASGSSGAATCPAAATYEAVSAPGLNVPDNTRRQSTSSVISIPVNGTITSLSVSVNMTHTYTGDLKVVLTSPSGTQAVLHNRAGGNRDNIITTYPSTNSALRAMAGSALGGNWTLSIGDYAVGDVGTLREWGITATYTPAPSAPPVPAPRQSYTTVFSDGFEGTLSKWIETGEGDWTTSTSQSHYEPTLPGRPSSNRVLHSDNCDSTCTMTLKTPIDLSRYSSATLSLWRFVDSGLDRGEYLKVELFDGTAWRTVYNWSHGSGDDNRWHHETYDLSPYMASTAFKIRLVTHQSSSSEDVQVDDVVINASSTSTAPAPAPTPAPAPAPTSGYSVYVADTDDYEVLAFSQAGAYQGTIVPRGSGGLKKAYDLDFGPDGHLYVLDRTDKKIRKYNGATGSSISAAAGWATTAGNPYALAWKGSVLYVATINWVERFSASGASLGYFGDATTRPTTAGALRVLTPYDVAFCADGRMYLADRSWGKILYYSASTGAYLGAISGTSSPNTARAAGVACGAAMSGTGTSLYQGGGDPGRINEINPSTGSLVRSVTSSIDEPYGMDMSGSGILYVANKDDDNVVRMQSGTVSVFGSGNDLDDPRGIAVGPAYSGSASGASGPSGATGRAPDDNDGPSLALLLGNGTAAPSPVAAQAGQRIAFQINASDPDGDPVAIRAFSDELAAGALTLTDRGNGTASLTIDTAGLAAGTAHVFWIVADDGRGEEEREPYAVFINE